MKKVNIQYISYYLPESVLTNNQLESEFPEWPAEKIASKIGIKERHLAAADETAVDMAIKAAVKLFDENSYDRKLIDFVLFCTQSGDYFLPSSACLIQNKLGLSNNCGAFDINLGCSGYEYGLAVAKGLIATEMANNVLLLTSETYSKYIHFLDKGNRSIFGDGASATIVSEKGFAEIGDFSFGTDGSGFDKLIVSTGCSRNKEKMNDLILEGKEYVKSSDYLYMDGRAIFDFSAEIVPDLIEKVLVKNAIRKEQVDLWVFHQANKYMINYLRKLMDIDKEKFYICLEHVGNTVSSTIPIALCEAKKEGRLSGKVLLAGFGVGLSWSGVLLTIAN